MRIEEELCEDCNDGKTLADIYHIKSDKHLCYNCLDCRD